MTMNNDRRQMVAGWRYAETRPCGVRLALIVTMTLVAGGCGYRRPVRLPVEGAVELAGHPVADASLVFIPEAGGRPATATTDEFGRFRVSTFGRSDGLARGTYRVVVTKHTLRPAAAKRHRRPPAKTDEDSTGWEIEFTDDAYINVLPVRYADAETSDVQVRIDGRKQPLRIALQTATDRPRR